MAPWFGRKRFGIGAGPRTWQGYLVVVVLVGLVFLARAFHWPQ